MFTSQSSSMDVSKDSLDTNIRKNAEIPVVNMNTKNMYFFTRNLSTMAPTTGFVNIDMKKRLIIMYPTVIFEYPNCLAYVEPKLRIVAIPENKQTDVSFHKILVTLNINVMHG